MWSESCSFQRIVVSSARIMSHSHSSWSDLPPVPLPRRLSSLLPPSHSDEQPLDPRTAGRSGRLAMQSPLTRYVWMHRRPLLSTLLPPTFGTRSPRVFGWVGTIPYTPSFSTVQARSTWKVWEKPSHRWWPGQHLLPMKPTIRSVVAALSGARRPSLRSHTFGSVGSCAGQLECANDWFKTVTTLSMEGGSECMFFCVQTWSPMFWIVLVHLGR